MSQVANSDDDFRFRSNQFPVQGRFSVCIDSLYRVLYTICKEENYLRKDGDMWG